MRELVATSLVCHAHAEMAHRCLGSLLKHCAVPVRLRIHDDGTLKESDVEKLLELDRAEIVSRSEADNEMEKVLAKFPAAFKLRKNFPLALKLFDTVLMFPGENFVFIDSDVLFLKKFSGFPNLPVDGANVVFMKDRAQSYSLRSWQKLFSPKVKLPAMINTGMICLKKSAYDLDFLNWFVGKSMHAGIPGMLEQTAWAALGRKIRCRVLCSSQARVMREGEDESELVAGHFTAKTRHLLDSYLPRVSPENSEISKLKTVETGNCSTFDLFNYETKRIFKRFWPSIGLFSGKTPAF